MKELVEIKALIERFFEGDTTLAEEQWLYDYFKQTKNPPEELEAYRDTFLDFDAIALTETITNEISMAEPAFMLPMVEQPVSSAPPKYRSWWMQVAGIAAMIAIVVGGVWTFQNYQDIQLEKMYGGSYMIVDGERIDDLRQILPQIKQTLTLADAIETTSPTLLIDQAEQDLLNNIQDVQERERIQALLNQ
jgi:cytochrome c-type biogenesis protein CcmH/NrfG